MCSLFVYLLQKQTNKQTKKPEIFPFIFPLANGQIGNRISFCTFLIIFFFISVKNWILTHNTFLPIPLCLEETN